MRESWQTTDGTTVRNRQADTDAERAQLRREATMLGLARHPAVAEVVSADDDGGQLTTRTRAGVTLDGGPQPGTRGWLKALRARPRRWPISTPSGWFTAIFEPPASGSTIVGTPCSTDSTTPVWRANASGAGRHCGRRRTWRRWPPWPPGVREPVLAPAHPSAGALAAIGEAGASRRLRDRSSARCWPRARRVAGLRRGDWLVPSTPSWRVRATAAASGIARLLALTAGLVPSAGQGSPHRSVPIPACRPSPLRRRIR